MALAKVALGHVDREYPNKLDHVLDGPSDARTPRDLHPLFFGSFDWHSCVHGFWTLARLLARFPTMSLADDIRALFAARITPALVAAECDYLARPSARGFERPYGWAWLLKLAEALAVLPDGRAGEILAPMTDAIVVRFASFLPLATYPVRTGTHGSTAFALALAADYGIAAGDDAFVMLLRATAERWYAADADCQAWEPGGDDFLSPALVEAACLQRLLPVGDFLPWFDRFLPGLARGEPATLFAPAAVSDRTDGKIAHLDGLNLSRAWCWRTLATALPPADPRHALAVQAADRHLAVALPRVQGHYMGEHWLQSFALMALEA